MKNTLFVCLFALTLGAIALPPTAAQTPALQKGVSVQMAMTQNALPMPEADNADAWIVTVTNDGRLFFGAEPVTPDSLTRQMTRTPRNRTANLYIKADARAPFSNVQRVLEIGRSMLFETQVLLTSQSDTPTPGTIVPPKGLEVLIGRAPRANNVATLVELLAPERELPVLKINGDPVAWADLQPTLTQHFEKGDEKLVLIKADGRLPFASVAKAIDLCRPTGAKVALAAPTL